MAVDPILVAIQAGDRTAWGHAYVEHRERMYAAAFRELRDHDDAMDAVQDAMSAIMTSPPASLARVHNLGAYLARTAYHKAIDLIRKNQRTHATDPDDINLVADDVVDIEQVVVHRVALESASDVLDQMPEKVRYAYVQRVLMARKAKDVAAELGCEPQYISQLIAAAISVLEEHSAFIERATSDPSSPATPPGETKDAT